MARAAAADAGRRVERKARRETLETLERVAGSAPSSPARAAKTTHAFGATSLGASSPRGYMSPKSMSPKSSPKKRLTNEPFVSSKQKPSGSLGSLLSRVGTVSGERAPGRKNRDVLTESVGVGGSYEQIVGARCAPVSLEDLEKSPSWQLQRRLESLEARAAALLLDEEEEAARR
jgi:hypothetical protein